MYLRYFFKVFWTSLINSFYLILSSSQKRKLCVRSYCERRFPSCNSWWWWTCTNKILRLYISEVKPSDRNKLLVCCIMKIYAPVLYIFKYCTTLYQISDSSFLLRSFRRPWSLLLQLSLFSRSRMTKLSSNSLGRHRTEFGVAHAFK